MNFISVSNKGISIERGSGSLTLPAIIYTNITEWKTKGLHLEGEVFFSSTVDNPERFTKKPNVIALAKYLRRTL